MMQFHPRHPSAKWIFFQGSAWILSKSIENMQNQNVEDKSMLTVAWLMLLFNSYLNNYIFLHCNISDSLQSHGLQQVSPPCPSKTSRVYPNSCSLSWWWHSTISSSVVPFSCLQSFPVSGSFQMNQFFTSVAKVLKFQIQHQCIQWIFRTGCL